MTSYHRNKYNKDTVKEKYIQNALMLLVETKMEPNENANI